MSLRVFGLAKTVLCNHNVIGGLRVINKKFACIRETNFPKHYQGSKLALANLLKAYIPIYLRLLLYYIIYHESRCVNISRGTQ